MNLAIVPHPVKWLLATESPANARFVSASSVGGKTHFRITEASGMTKASAISARGLGLP